MKTNFHTHSLFCDGKDLPEEIVKKAIEKKFDILGFSSHSMFPFGADWHISPYKFQEYTQEIQRLKESYKNKIQILLGFEVDYLSPLTFPKKEIYKGFSPDYLIGSVHYLTTDKGWFTVDGPVQELEYGLNDLFNGNGKKLVQEYFYTQRQMLSNGEFDILGHPDVIRKRNGVLHFFDETESWYKSEIEETAKAIAQSGVIVEINTGGIARGVINDTYPSLDFLKTLNKYDVPITINSDAHNAQDLDCAFDFAKKQAAEAGYKEVTYLQRLNDKTEKRFISINQFN